MILTMDHAINQIVPLLKQQKLVVFIGSGISAAAGLPTWDTLLRKYIDFCRELQDLLQPDERFDALLDDAEKQIDKHPTRVASVLKSQLVELDNRKSQNIYRAFQQWLFDIFLKAEPHENHRLIVSTNYAQILTSNYDLLLEDAAKLEGYKSLALLNSYTYKDAAKVAAALYQNYPSIIHVHGDINGITLNDIVFTSEDYFEIERKNPGFTLALRTMFLTNSVLFIGYGGSDPHFEDFIEDISYNLNWETNENLPKTFLVLREDKVGEVLNKYKKKLRTDIISMKSYDETTEFLRILRESSPRGQINKITEDFSHAETIKSFNFTKTKKDNLSND